MRKTKQVLIVPLLAVLVLPASQEPQQPTFLQGRERTAFLAAVEAKMQEVVRVVAEFEQEKHLQLFEDVVKSQGLIVYEAPDRLRWEIQSPFSSVLVVAGDQVAKFEGVDGKLQKLELGRAGDIVLGVMGQIRTWFRGNFDKAGGTYLVQVAQKPQPLVVLQPLDKVMQKGLERIELSLSEDLSAVTCVTIRESGGDFTVMRCTGLVPVPPLPTECFSVTAPAPLDKDVLRQASAAAAAAARAARGGEAKK